jgi:hypothetical protein
MIHITAQMRVLVAIEPVDGRKGIDSLVRVCQEKLSEDPISGCVFIFRSRRGTSIRLLSYDGQGYWLAQKRLSKGGSRGGLNRVRRPSAGGLRSPVADGGRRCVASTRRADVAASERAEVRIKKIINTPLRSKKTVHTAGQWQSSDIAGVRSERKTSSIYAR